jgi:hypothetical protein
MKEISKFVFRNKNKGPREDVARSRKEFIEWLKNCQELYRLDYIQKDEFRYHYYSTMNVKAH